MLSLFKPIQIQTGLHVQTPENLLQAIFFSLVNHLFPGNPNKQITISRSSSEAEYRAMASAASEVTWTVRLLE